MERIVDNEGIKERLKTISEDELLKEFKDSMSILIDKRGSTDVKYLLWHKEIVAEIERRGLILIKAQNGKMEEVIDEGSTELFIKK